MQRMKGRSLIEINQELRAMQSQLMQAEQGVKNCGDALNHNTDVIANAMVRFETLLYVMRLINNLVLQGRREEIVLTLDGQANYDYYAEYWEACMGFAGFVAGLKEFDGGRSELIVQSTDDEVIIFGGQ